jgi:hypothetical protein
MEINQLSSLVIKFETADMVGAPFSHQILLKMQFAGQGIEVDFQIAYIDREDLSEEEILEEGFSLNDDYSWKGQIDNAWLEPIKEILKKTPNKFNHKALEEEMNFFEIEVNQQSAGNPINQTDWEYFFQELIQAIYETSQKEAPFHLEYRRIDKDKNVKNFELNLYYAKRQAEGINSIGKTDSKPITWAQANAIIQQVFIGEFIPDAALKNEPKHTGKYISVGDGYWYEFTKSLKRPNGNKGYLTELEKTFDPWVD